MAKTKTKEARVEIVLPDGTKISARGPMAEQMARRLMDPQWHYAWPWYSGPLISSGTIYGAANGAPDSGVAITGANGSITANASAEQVQSAVLAGFDSAQR